MGVSDGRLLFVDMRIFKQVTNEQASKLPGTEREHSLGKCVWQRVINTYTRTWASPHEPLNEYYLLIGFVAAKNESSRPYGLKLLTLYEYLVNY